MLNALSDELHFFDDLLYQWFSEVANSLHAIQSNCLHFYSDTLYLFAFTKSQLQYIDNQSLLVLISIYYSVDTCISGEGWVMQVASLLVLSTHLPTGIVSLLFNMTCFCCGEEPL